MINGNKRIKSSNNIILFINNVFLSCKKFSTLILIILLSTILYFGPPVYLNSLSLELTGKIIVLGIRIYDTIINPINDLTTKIASLYNLKIENEQLKLDLKKFKDLENENNIVKAENENLKSILKIVPDTNFNYIKARLLSVESNPFNKTILIGAGAKQGVKVDQIVTNNEVLLGRIVEVSNHYSKVMLINNFNSRVPVITSNSRQRAILGVKNYNLDLTYLTDADDLVDQEVIITSGDGKIYPYGIPVAKIEIKDDKKIVIHPLTNLSLTQFVNIYETNE